MYYIYSWISTSFNLGNWSEIHLSKSWLTLSDPIWVWWTLIHAIQLHTSFKLMSASVLNAHPVGKLVTLPEQPGCGVREHKTPPWLNNVFPSEVQSDDLCQEDGRGGWTAAPSAGMLEPRSSLFYSDSVSRAQLEHPSSSRPDSHGPRTYSWWAAVQAPSQKLGTWCCPWVSGTEDRLPRWACTPHTLCGPWCTGK